MTVQDRIRKLFEENAEKKPAALARVLNTRQSTIDGWTKQNRCPAANLIPLIANFFDVSLEYILTGKEPEIEGLDEEEAVLVRGYRKLDKPGKLRVAIALQGEVQRVTEPAKLIAKSGKAMDVSLTAEENELFEKYLDEMRKDRREGE